MRRSIWRWLAVPLALLGLLLSAAPANAQLDLTAASDNGRPDNTQAGAHSNFHVHFTVNGSDNLRTLRTELPPGLVGNPQAAGVCAPTQLVNDACPATSRVGSATSDVTASIPSLGLSGLPLTVSGDVYNVIPQASDPATLGIVLRA